MTEAVAIILGTLLLGALAAIAAALETSLTVVSRAKIEAFAENGNKRAVKLHQVLDRRSETLAGILMLSLGARLAAIALVGYFAFDRWEAGGYWIAMAVVVLLSYLLTSMLPKLAALRQPETLTLRLAAPLRLLSRSPLLRWVNRLSRLPLGDKAPPYKSIVSEQELLAVAEQAKADASIKAEEGALIQAILNFDDATVRNIMVPRTDIITINADQTIPDALAEALQTTYSRFPVIGDSPDQILGIVHTRDLMVAVQRDREASQTATVDSILREVILVPDTKPAADLLREMQESSLQMAVLIDEFGGTAGLVTLEDLIEELVGEITDEFDVEEPLIERLGGNEGTGGLRVNGRAPQQEIEQVLGVELPKGDWTTIGGLIFTHLGHLPQEGEDLQIGEFCFHVERILNQRIARVKIAKL